MNFFHDKIAEASPEALRTADTRTLQVNICRKCSLECGHCHLECSPSRTEMMELSTMRTILRTIPQLDCKMVDITGGAPELHPELKSFITGIHKAGKAVQVRTNLVSLTDELIAFLKDNDVMLVASMPCYLEENVNAQRGDGVYENSIERLQSLNSVGYGTVDGLQLNLVYNPGDASLPGPQKHLEDAYRKELRERFDITFTQLLAITNIPIGRFAAALRKQGKFDEYMQILMGAFNPETVDGIMCRHQLCVDWDGQLYDCDFNIALAKPCDIPEVSIEHLTAGDLARLVNRKIVTGPHCYGCTAGSGSSCGGALT